MYYVHCKNINNYFRSNGRQDGYEALESESFREGSLLQSLDETSKIRNGFADLFDQFQSFGDESQNNVTFWQKKTVFEFMASISFKIYWSDWRKYNSEEI